MLTCYLGLRLIPNPDAPGEEHLFDLTGRRTLVNVCGVNILVLDSCRLDSSLLRNSRTLRRSPSIPFVLKKTHVNYKISTGIRHSDCLLVRNQSSLPLRALVPQDSIILRKPHLNQKVSIRNSLLVLARSALLLQPSFAQYGICRSVSWR